MKVRDRERQLKDGSTMGYRLRRWLFAWVFAAALPLAAIGAAAQTAPSPGQGSPASPSDGKSQVERQQDEIKAAWTAANGTATMGPATIKLLDQGELRIPAGFAFVPQQEATRVLRAYGNSTSPTTVGLVVGTGPNDDWMAVLRFIKEGYIKDDDAKDWNADDLLANIREGTEEANKDRVERGFSKLQIIGWVEKPAYDSQHHRLVWSLSSRQENQPASDDLGVNYNTYALGRDGYFSLNLLTTMKEVEAHKPVAQQLLSDLSYVQGKRYEDFDAKTDKVAAYGLAALVAGAAAKKLGVFAVVAAFLLKFAKVGLLALGALGMAIFKLIGRKPKAET